MLAAEEDARDVDGHHPVPRFQVRVQDRPIAVGHDPGVVEHDVDPAELACHPVIDPDDAGLVDEVRAHEQVAVDVTLEVDADDRRPLAPEHIHGGAPDRSGRASDHTDLAFEMTHVHDPQLVG
jgi:hypothetical protein